jgi:hypothetical protein
MRSGSISQEAEPYTPSVRDETSYYQAESQSLSRENQMLRHRIRELGKSFWRPTLGTYGTFGRD